MADKSMTFKIGARDDASSVFTRVGQAVERLNTQLDDLGRKHAKPRVTLDGADAAKTRVTELGQAMRELRNARVRVDAELGTSRADVGDLRRELSYLRDVRVKVRVDTGTATTDVAALGAQMASFRDVRAAVRLDTDQALTRVAALRARLDELRDVKVKVEVEAGDARAELTAIARAARRLNGLNGNDVRIRVVVDISPPGIRAELEAIAGALRRIRDRQVRVTASSNAAAVVEDVRRLGAELGRIGKGGAISLTIAGLPSTLAQVGSLGASVVQLTGVLGLVPAAGAAAAAGIAAVAVGLSGFGDALEARDDAEAFAEALKNLSPAAAAAATTVRDLGGSWTEMRKAVQDRLFAGVAEEIQQLSGTYLPVLQAGLGGIADEVNVGARSFSDWVTQGRTVADVNTILGNTRSTLRELAPAGVNVAAALTDVAVVGSGLMPELAAGATEATGRFREFVAEARRTGELEQWIRGGITQVQQLGRITLNTGQILGAVFAASEEAGYGFLDAVEQATAEVEALLSSAEGRDALVDLFRGSQQVIGATLPGMRELGAATLTTIGAFAANDGVAEFGGALSNVARAAAPVVGALGSLASGTLQALAGGANIATAALGPVAGLLSGLLNALGPIPGGVLAAVAAFRVLGTLTPMLATLSTSLYVASIQAASFVATMTGSAALTTVTGTALRGLGTAAAFLARSLPLIGVAAIAAGLGLDAFTTSTAEAVAIMTEGGPAADELTGTLIAQQTALTTLLGPMAAVGAAQALGIGTIQSATVAYAEQQAALSPLELAQQRVQRATEAYNVALRESGPNSQRTADAARELATATDAVESETRRAEAATQSYTDSLIAQTGAAQSALGANLDLEAALARVAESQIAANDAARDYGAGSQEAATAMAQFVADADQAAQAAARVAEQQAEANEAGTGAAAGAAAYGASLLNMAATATGPAQSALLGHIANLSDAQLQALSAGAAATGFATQLLTLPDGRTVTIAVDPQTGKIVDTQTLLDGMADADVAVNIETQAAMAELGNFVGIVNGTAGTVIIDGNPQAAGTALQTVLGQIAAGQASVNINGQTVPAQQALSMIVGQISASGAMVTIGGQAQPAGAVLSATLAAIRAGREDVTIGGKSFPAMGVLSALLGSVNSSTGTIGINGRDNGVAALKARLSAPSSSTHTINVVERRRIQYAASNPGLNTNSGYKLGGIAPAQRFHDGGVAVARMATGGQIPRPFTAGRAQVFPPRVLRITGDRTDVDEFYIPDNRAPRSMALGQEWARRRGMDLVPRSTAAATSSAVVPSTVRDRVVQMALQPRAAAATVSVPPVDLRPVATELRAVLQTLVGTTDQRAVVAAVDRLADRLVSTTSMSAAEHRLAGTDGAW